MNKNKPNLLAIVFSDLHLNIWAKFNDDNQRTKNGFKILELIAGISDKKLVPALFCGDMFNKPENLDQDLAVLLKLELKRIFDNNPKSKIIAIEGNHDLKYVNKWPNLGKGWISVIEDSKNIVVIDPYNSPIDISKNVQIFGVPYIDHNINLSDILKNMDIKEGKKSILLLHTDYPGAKDTDGREVDSVENININLLNKFDLVLCGHIHKPQRLSKKVYMVGAPLQQRRTDSNCKLGYWKLYSDLSMKFVELTDFPKFIDVDNESEIKDDGNYYTLLPKKTSVVVNNEHKINKKLSKKSLARRYMREKGIKDANRKNLLIDILNKAELC